MKDHELEAVRLLGVYTARSFRLTYLLGNAKASCRADIMTALSGVKTSQAKSGFNALRSAFNALAAIQGGCIAAREDELIQWCKAVEAQHEWASDRQYGRKN